MDRLNEIKCFQCGKRLLVPANVHTVRCSVCRATLKIQIFPRLFTSGGVFGPHYRSNYGELNNGMIENQPPGGRYGNPHPFGSVYGRRYGTYGTHSYSPHEMIPQDPMFGARPRIEGYMPAAMPVGMFGRKRAVLCGVNYNNMMEAYSLRGSINDVKSMRNFLIKKAGFPEDYILMLTEDSGHPDLIPTKANIRRAMSWLVKGSRWGDSLVFHFSGHGSTQKDFNGDENDGVDEALCPIDHETEGKIIDDEINHTLVRPLNAGVTLHAIIDACYSGTVLDLPRVCRMNREGEYHWEDHCPRNVYKGTSGGLAVCFSACDDGHTSCDTSAFTGENTGAMTYSFIKAASSESEPTYGRLLNLMRSAIRDASRGEFDNTNISEEPQLSSSEQFNVYSKKFLL